VARQHLSILASRFIAIRMICGITLLVSVHASHITDGSCY
jgi:hypothetical protein